MKALVVIFVLAVSLLSVLYLSGNPVLETLAFQSVVMDAGGLGSGAVGVKDGKSSIFPSKGAQATLSSFTSANNARYPCAQSCGTGQTCVTEGPKFCCLAKHYVHGGFFSGCGSQQPATPAPTAPAKPPAPERMVYTGELTGWRPAKEAAEMDKTSFNRINLRSF